MAATFRDLNVELMNVEHVQGFACQFQVTFEDLMYGSRALLSTYYHFGHRFHDLKYFEVGFLIFNFSIFLEFIVYLRASLGEITPPYVS